MPDQDHRRATLEADIVAWERRALKAEKALAQRDEELRERLEKLPRFEPGKAGGLSSTELSGRLIIRAEALSIFEEADDA